MGADIFPKEFVRKNDFGEKFNRRAVAIKD